MPDPNGTPDKEKWEELGFADEASMHEAAKAATDLRSQIAKAEDDLKKEKAAKSKTDSDYLRQSNEIGELRKKLKEVEKVPDAAPVKDESNNDEVLESLSDDERARYDGILDDPKNVELKKSVALGGEPAMAEFVKAYRINAPVDTTVSLFAGLKKKKTDTVQLSSIAKAVQDLFKKHNDEEKNNLAAAPASGTLPDRLAKSKKQMVVGGVDVDYFRKQT